MTDAAVSVATTVAASGSEAPVLTQAPSDAVYLATMMLAGRWFYRGDAPLGIAGGELGAVYVARRDPDVASMLRGKRINQAASSEQRWPTVEEIADRYRIGASTEDARIDEVRLAAIETVKGLLQRSWGIG